MHLVIHQLGPLSRLLRHLLTQTYCWCGVWNIISKVGEIQSVYRTLFQDFLGMWWKNLCFYHGNVQQKSVWLQLQGGMCTEDPNGYSMGYLTFLNT